LSTLQQLRKLGPAAGYEPGDGDLAVREVDKIELAEGLECLVEIGAGRGGRRGRGLEARPAPGAELPHDPAVEVAFRRGERCRSLTASPLARDRRGVEHAAH
jgi:hypothetical protein